MDVRQANKLYESFPIEARDMSRMEFIKRVVRATDPVRMQKDMSGIMRAKREKARIDRALK